jgi:uncharacterized YccA/Bax inhibitor family protein
MLLVLLAAAAGVSWNMLLQAGGFQGVIPYVIGGLIVALISGLVIHFTPRWSGVLAPVYAVSEGLVLGAISAVYQMRYENGIVFQAVCLTFGTLFSLLTAYRTGLIKATEKFKLGVFAATGGIALLYLANMVMHMFNMKMPFLHESGAIGIAINLFIVVIAALNLVLDFDFIEQGAKRGAPKYMEWYAGFGLLVTLVWLYIEFLRLLAKLRDR